MNNTTKNVREENELTSEVNYRDGYHFDFEVDGHNVHAHGSSKSGKETVLVNGEIVAEKRSFRRKSTLNFSIEENTYEIEFNMVNMLTGELHCTLIKNNMHIKTFKKALKKSNQLSLKSSSMWLFFAGGFFGYILMAELLRFING
jgi:hypothetical protein